MKPFLKWVGGKTRSLEAVVEALPPRIEGYYEPCLGSGAVFFRLAALGRFRRAYLSDSNPELITTFTVVRDQLEPLVEELRKLRRKPITEARYYRLRATKPRSPVAIAARMIVLNKTCYSGLYRVNQSGAFNAPFGRYKNPGIFDAGHLRACSELLQGVVLLAEHYLWAVAFAEPGDAIYLDPPYLPRSSGKSIDVGYDGYTTTGFDVHAHKRLAEHCRTLTKRGVAWVASNADTPLARQYYAQEGVKLRELQVGRTVSSKASTRTPVSELLIWHRPKTAGKVADE